MLATIQFRIFSLYLLSKNLKTKIYRAIILPLVWYRYGTWSFTLREEHSVKEQGAAENI
jgi:hypothetical protein